MTELQSAFAAPPAEALANAAAAADKPLPGPEAAWFVCHTKPRCEKKFAALMRAERFEHYLPLVDSVRRYAQQTKRFTKPLFPGYVFAWVPLERKARIYQQDLLARAIPVTDEALFLRQLDSVKVMIASGYQLTVLPLLTRGRRVKVAGGPLHGLEGYVDDPANPRGIVVSVDVLRQGLLVKLPVENLVVLP
jgi:transcription antitermination factor NusG